MKSELSRRDFLKVAAVGLGAIALDGLLSACGKKEPERRCADPKHTVTLEAGDYVLFGEYTFKLIDYKWLGGVDYAFFTFRDRWGNEVEHEVTGVEVINLGLPEQIEVGELLGFDYDQENKLLFRRVIYRCSHDEFAFWEFKDLPTQGPTLKPTSAPTLIPTHIPAAIFP